MSINAAPSLNRHDPTNPHPVSVVSGWNPAEECPELTRISLGLSGITQAGEGLNMIASLEWGGGVGVCVSLCVRVCAYRWTCVKLWNIDGGVCLHVQHVYKAAWTEIDMVWFPHLLQSAVRCGNIWKQFLPLCYDKVRHTDIYILILVVV